RRKRPREVLMHPRSYVRYARPRVSPKERHAMADRRLTREQIESLGSRLDADDLQAAALVAEERDEVRVASGQKLVLGREGNRAPGFLTERGERPYSLARIVRSLVEKDKTLAPAEWDLSQKLSEAGYGSQPGAAIVPWSASSLYLVAGHEAQVDLCQRMT